MNLDNLSIKEIWNEIATQADAHPEYFQDISATYNVSVKTKEQDENTTLILNDGTYDISDGAADDADCSLFLNESNFKKLLQGNLNTTTAFMTGKLKVKGNIGLALKLEQTLKKFSF